MLCPPAAIPAMESRPVKEPEIELFVKVGLARSVCMWVVGIWGVSVDRQLGGVGSSRGCSAPRVVVHPLETATAEKQRGEQLQKCNKQPSWESNRRVEAQRSGAGKWSGCPGVGGMGQLLRSALRIIH